jgi:excisionase family DNA binding protein
VVEKLFRIKEVAAITGEDVQTLYRRIREGEIKAVRIGKKSIRIAESELNNWIDDVKNLKDKPHNPCSEGRKTMLSRVCPFIDGKEAKRCLVQIDRKFCFDSEELSTDRGSDGETST